MKTRQHPSRTLTPILSLAAALAVAAAGVAGPRPAAAAVEGSFERVWSLEGLVAGDYVVTGTKANTEDHFAMKAELGGNSPTYILRHGDEPLPVEGDAIADPDESIVWTLEAGESGGWTLRNGENYAGYKGSGNGAAFLGAAVSNALWTIAAGGGAAGLFAVENAAKPGRILQYNGTSGQERFACYTNWGNRAQGLAFWRRDGSQGGGGGEGTVPHAIAVSPYIEHGTLSTDPSGQALPGVQVEVTGVPDEEGWHLAEVTVTGDSSALSWTYPTDGDPVAFPMPGEDVTLTARFEQDGGGDPGPGPGPDPGLSEILFEGDDTGLVGAEAAFAVLAPEGMNAFLATFEPPEGSELAREDLGLDLPYVTFVPDVPGVYRFGFAAGGAAVEATGEWTVTVEPAPVEPLLITSIAVEGAAVTLEYLGDAGSVEGTDDLTGAADTWSKVVGAVLDQANQTATLPARKPFLRLSSEPPIPEAYLVVDMGGGPDAASWPVTELSSIPEGGWSEEYTTSKLLLRKLPAGSFTMGSPTNELGRFNGETRHTVTLTQPFYMGVFEVTQRQWELATGKRPGYFTNESCYASRPVEKVCYDDIRGSSAGAQWPASGEVDAESFLGILRAKTGLPFDLPTEAQWEYACRAGTETALNSGKDLTDEDECPNMAAVGRYWLNGGDDAPSCDTSAGTAAVGSYLPNAWGLYDMHGNVYELCLDWYGSSDPGDAVDPVGPASGSYRVQRGGGWFNYAQYCRSAYRYYNHPSYRSIDFGFRLCCSAGLP